MSVKLSDLQPGDIITAGELLGTSEEGPAQLRWIRGEDSPFGIDVLDCRAFALHHMSTTASDSIAESFLHNTQSDGTVFVNTLPKNPVRFDIPLAFRLGQVQLNEGAVFVASQMEEKWNIYYFAPILYFVRSWTGMLVHAACCEIKDGTLLVSSIVTNEEFIDIRDRSFPIREVFFLVVSHVLGDVYPHPIPAFIEAKEDLIAQFSFSQYGNMGLFASIPHDSLQR
jgi:hypothetical protein